jgi:Transposase IS66 family.
MFDNLDLTSIQDENARELIGRLLNLIEKQAADLRDAQAEIQRLRDENNRLKGEQGKPKIKGNTPKPPAEDHSSEKERHKTRQRHKSSKKANIHIDREQVLEVDPAILPPDAKYKGSEDVVVQDIVLGTNNVLFHKQKYYSRSTRQSYQAELPRGYSGQFGPGVQALVLTFYYGMQASEPKIVEFLENVGIQISGGEISNWLIQERESFHAEKDAVYEAGLASSPYQQTDDTVTRLDGQNQHCHVVCNPVYTAYHTRPSKERLSVLDVLRNGRERIFRLNAEALGYLENQLKWSKAVWGTLQSWVAEQDLDEDTFLKRLDTELPGLGKQHRKLLIDAAAVAAYHAETGFPVVQALICDDAPQFNWLARMMMQCWVHEGRHYKKLSPVVALHREQLDGFLKRFWEYYDQLLAYRQDPTPDERQRLETEFDSLFAPNTGYEELDKRIAKTQAKKESLLLVLKYPELPLHNNAAELGVRQRVRKRDVSFGPRTQAGVRAWDTFATMAATSKKLGVSFYQYIHDRISGANQIPPMADLVTMAAKELNLGWSFSVA